jgi:hypothetical protein
MEKQLSTESLEETKELAEALKNGNWEKAAQEMKKMREKLQKMLDKKKLSKQTLNETEKKQLQKIKEELNKLSKAMKNNSELEKQLKETLKDLSEQVSKMPKLDRLSAKETEQELDKLAKSLEKMQSAEQQLKDLQSLVQQMKMMREMYESLDNTRKQLAGKKPQDMLPDDGKGGKGEEGKPVFMPDMDKLAQGDQNGKNCGGKGKCQVKGCTHGEGGEGGKEGDGGNGQGLGGKGPGRGKGGKPPETKGKGEGWKPLAVKGQDFQGKTIAQFEFRGDAPKGKANAAYREYAQKMATEATSGLSDKKIPKQYQEYVKKYFATVTEEK